MAAQTHDHGNRYVFGGRCKNRSATCACRAAPLHLSGFGKNIRKAVGAALVASGVSEFSAVNRSFSAESATFVFDNAFSWADSTMLSALSGKNCDCLKESFGCAPGLPDRLVSIVICAGGSALTWLEVVGIQRLRCLGPALLVDTILSPTTWFAQPCGGVVKVASTKR